LSGILHLFYEWGHENAAKFQVEVGEPLKEFGREKPRD
jgi:hypothetical protein